MSAHPRVSLTHSKGPEEVGHTASSVTVSDIILVLIGLTCLTCAIAKLICCDK